VWYALKRSNGSHGMKGQATQSASCCRHSNSPQHFRPCNAKCSSAADDDCGVHVCNEPELAAGEYSHAKSQSLQRQCAVDTVQVHKRTDASLISDIYNAKDVIENPKGSTVGAHLKLGKPLDMQQVPS